LATGPDDRLSRDVSRQSPRSQACRPHGKQSRRPPHKSRLARCSFAGRRGVWRATLCASQLARGANPCRQAQADRTRRGRHSQVRRGGGSDQRRQARSRRKQSLRRRSGTNAALIFCLRQIKAAARRRRALTKKYNLDCKSLFFSSAAVSLPKVSKKYILSRASIEETASHCCSNRCIHASGRGCDSAGCRDCFFGWRLFCPSLRSTAPIPFYFPLHGRGLVVMKTL